MASYIKTFIGSGTQYWKLTPNNGVYVSGTTSFSDGRTLIVGQTQDPEGYPFVQSRSSYLWIGSDGNQKYEWFGLPNTTGTIFTYDSKLAVDGGAISYGKFYNPTTGHYLPVLSKFSSGYIDSWAKIQTDDTGTNTTISDNGFTRQNRITVDSLGNTYMIVTIGDERTGFQSPRARDSGIAKFNSSGDLQWVKHFYAGSADETDDVVEIEGIACFSDNSVIAVGWVGFFGGTAKRLSMININGSGNIIWARYNMKAASGTVPYVIHSIAVDSSDNIIILETDKISVYDDNYTPPLDIGQTQQAIAKFDSTGNPLWFKSLFYRGTEEWPPLLRYGRLALDSSNNIYLAQVDEQSQISNPDPPYEAINEPSHNLYYIIAKFSSAGALSWVRRLEDKEVSSNSRQVYQWPSISINNYDSAYVLTTEFNVFKLPTDGTRTGNYSLLNYTDDISRWTTASETHGSGDQWWPPAYSGAPYFTATTNTITFDGFGIQEQGKMNWTLDTNLIAAPGKVRLGAVNLESEVSAGKEGGTYNAPGYFTPEDYVETVEVTVGTFTGNVIRKTTMPLSADFVQTASINQRFAGKASITTDFDSVFRGGIIFLPTVINSADFTVTPVPKLTLRSTVDASIDTTLSASAGVIRSTGIEPSAEVDTDFLGNQIHDIGVSYAYDWVIPEDEYVLPYKFLKLIVDTAIYAAASVEVVPYANLLADCGITGNGGYFLAYAQSLIGGETDLEIQPFTLNGGTGIIFNQLTELDTEFTQSALGGRLFSPAASTMSSDFEFFTSGGRYQILAGVLRVDTALTPISDLFKATSTQMRVDTDVLATGGKYWSAQSTLSADFLIPGIRARIISIDEYYVDKVTKEIRNITVFQEQRTAFIPVESQTIAVFLEDRINQVAPENRQLRLEPGTPIQVGSRNRRITA